MFCERYQSWKRDAAPEAKLPAAPKLAKTEGIINTITIFLQFHEEIICIFFPSMKDALF